MICQPFNLVEQWNHLSKPYDMSLNFGQLSKFAVITFIFATSCLFNCIYLFLKAFVVLWPSKSIKVVFKLAWTSFPTTLIPLLIMIQFLFVFFVYCHLSCTSQLSQKSELMERLVQSTYTVTPPLTYRLILGHEGVLRAIFNKLRKPELETFGSDTMSCILH